MHRLYGLGFKVWVVESFLGATVGRALNSNPVFQACVPTAPINPTP